MSDRFILRAADIPSVYPRASNQSRPSWQPRAASLASAKPRRRRLWRGLVDGLREQACTGFQRPPAACRMRLTRAWRWSSGSSERSRTRSPKSGATHSGPDCGPAFSSTAVSPGDSSLIRLPVGVCECNWLRSCFSLSRETRPILSGALDCPGATVVGIAVTRRFTPPPRPQNGTSSSPASAKASFGSRAAPGRS